MIVKILLSIALILSLVYVLGQKRLLNGIRISLYLVICTGLFFVWSPDRSTAIANMLGIGRGADLIYYVWIVLSLSVFINIHLKLRENNALITQLTRQIAIANALQGMGEDNVKSAGNAGK